MSVSPIIIDTLSTYTGIPGQSLFIYGQNFSFIDKVVYSGDASFYPSGITGNFHVLNSTTIVSTIPSGIISGNIQVISSKNYLTGIHTGMTIPPSILGFFPPSGITGSSVIISGNNFNGVTNVYFSGTNATSFTITNNTGINAIVPTGAYEGNIKLVGFNNVTTYSKNQFNALVNISGISPDQAKTGTTFFISGGNFIPEILSSSGDEMVKVNFGGISNYLYRINETLLSGTIPETALTGKISLYRKNGIDLYPSNTYLNIIDTPPILNDFFPNSIRSGESFYGFLAGKNLRLVTGIAFSGISSGANGNTGSYVNFGTGNYQIDSLGNKINISGVLINDLNIRSGIHTIIAYNNQGDFGVAPNSKYLLIVNSGVY